MRIFFDTWGKGDWKVPAYAILADDGYSTPLSAVVAAVARKNRLECCAGPQSQGTALDRPRADHYNFTLGVPCTGGGYSPRFEVWVSIPRGQVRRHTTAPESLCYDCGACIEKDGVDYLCDECRMTSRS